MYQGNGRLIMDCVPNICAMSATNALSSKTLPGSLHTIVMHGGNNFYPLVGYLSPTKLPFHDINALIHRCLAVFYCSYHLVQGFKWAWLMIMWGCPNFLRVISVVL